MLQKFVLCVASNDMHAVDIDVSFCASRDKRPQVRLLLNTLLHTLYSSDALLLVRVTSCMENLEMSGILTAVSEMSWILLKVSEGKCRQGKIVVRAKWPKTVYCKLHICLFLK